MPCVYCFAGCYVRNGMDESFNSSRKPHQSVGEALISSHSPTSHCQMTQPVYIVSAVRTPMGSFQGALSNVPATQLGAVAIKGALSAGSIDPNVVDEVFMGHVLQAGAGQAPASSSHGRWQVKKSPAPRSTRFAQVE